MFRAMILNGLILVGFGAACAKQSKEVAVAEPAADARTVNAGGDTPTHDPVTNETIETLKAIESELSLDVDGKRARYAEVKGLQPEQMPVTAELIARLSQNRGLLRLRARLGQAEKQAASLQANHPDEKDEIGRATDEVGRLAEEHKSETARLTLKYKAEFIESRRADLEESENLLARCRNRRMLAERECNQRELQRVREATNTKG